MSGDLVPVRPPRNKAWTGAELQRASALWKTGLLHREIAERLGRTPKSIENLSYKNRELFPPRSLPRADVERGVEKKQLQLAVTRFLHQTIHAAAKREGRSANSMIEQVLREHFIGGGKPQAKGKRA